MTISLWEDLNERACVLGRYIVKTGATVRECAKVFSISKSTVHKDVGERLEIIDYQLYLDVRKVLDYNLSMRHIRGGNATKLKYSKRSKCE